MSIIEDYKVLRTARGQGEDIRFIESNPKGCYPKDKREQSSRSQSGAKPKQGGRKNKRREQKIPPKKGVGEKWGKAIGRLAFGKICKI